jgi:putative flippase GtrA
MKQAVRFLVAGGLAVAVNVASRIVNSLMLPRPAMLIVAPRPRMRQTGAM